MTIWLDRPPHEDDAVQLISTRRMYDVVRVLADGKVRIHKKGWPMMDVWPERLRVLNREQMALGLEGT